MKSESFFKEGSWKLFSAPIGSIHNAAYFLDQLVEDSERSGDTSSWIAVIHEQFNFRIKFGYRRSFRRRITRMKEIVLLLPRQQRNEQPKTSTRSLTSYSTVALWKTFNCIQEVVD